MTVVIPAFNEQKTIGHVIEKTVEAMDNSGLPYEIIVVDDGSTDNTKQIASTHKVTLLSNDKNMGKGNALRKAFQTATGNILVTIDADGAHDPKEILTLINPLLNGTDIVSGSRYLGNGRNWTTRINRVGNSMFNITITALTGKYVTDSQTGFRAIKREVLEKLNLNSNGYEVETEITVKSLKNGFIFKEEPITCTKREHNISKLKILSDGTKIFTTIFKSNLAKIEH